MAMQKQTAMQRHRMERYRSHIATLKAHRNRLVAYKCPGCKFTIEALVPPRGEEYDTIVSCPECDKNHFRVVRRAATVEIVIHYQVAAK